MIYMSVIVPVHNVEGYVRQCLRSILDQAGPETEVIVVEDHSTDRSAHIVRDVADHDDRVTIVAPPENVGLGMARNLGLERARGEYVMFIDSDDYLYPGKFQPIIRSCKATGADLVIFDYARLYWNDRHKRNVLARLLRGHDEPIVLRDEPELLRLLNVAWNKAYRREFLESSGLRFPKGYYEDIPWTYPLLCMAGSIALLDECCVAYRQRRGGSILRTSDDRHMELIDQLDRLFELVDAVPSVAAFEDELWGRAVSHVLAVLAHGERRLPSELRREFFMSASALLGRRAASLNSLDLNRQGRAKARMLASGNYRGFELLKVANGRRIKVRNAVRKRKTKIRRFAGRRKRALVAAVQKRSEGGLNENLAVFTSLWNRPPSGNPAAIYRKLQEMAPDIEVVWAIRDTWAGEVPEDLPIVLSGTREYREIVHSAKWLINDVNFPDYISHQEGQIHLQTQHGTPLKFMGLDLQAYPVAAGGMNFGKLMRRVDRWDFNLSSNRYSTEVWRRAFPASHEILEYGYPRNDVLVNPPAGLAEATRKRLGIPEGNVVLLYTPTHRDGEKQFDLGLDPAAFVDALGPRYSLIVRGHYFYSADDRMADLVATGRVVDGSAGIDIEELYLASDAMITDYSSAMFDFAVLRRPIVIFGYDWERYRALRGTYFDIMEEPPGPSVRSFDALVNVFSKGEHLQEASFERLDRFRSIFCQFDDGRAAERVVRKIFMGEDPEVPGNACGTPAALRTWNVQRPG